MQIKLQYWIIYTESFLNEVPSAYKSRKFQSRHKKKKLLYSLTLEDFVYDTKSFLKKTVLWKYF